MASNKLVPQSAALFLYILSQSSFFEILYDHVEKTNDLQYHAPLGAQASQ